MNTTLCQVLLPSFEIKSISNIVDELVSAIVCVIPSERRENKDTGSLSEIIHRFDMNREFKYQSQSGTKAHLVFVKYKSK